MIRRARAGNRGAFDRLVGRYRGMVLAMTFIRTGDREEAEDLAQEVLARAWQKLPDLADSGAFSAWLRAITANACRDWQRRRVHRPAYEILDCVEQLPVACQYPSAFDEVLIREERRRWRQILLLLPEANRLPFVMHELAGYSYEEIAGLLDVPFTTIEGRIYRAKQKLRGLLRGASTSELKG